MRLTGPGERTSHDDVLSEGIDLEGSLLGRVVRGGVWAGAGGILTAALPMLRRLFLMRGFLKQDDFWLWTAVWVVVSAANVLTATGIEMALIQKSQGHREDYLQTAWMIQTLRGLLLAVLTFAGASLVGWFYERPELVPPMRCMAGVLLLNGLASPRVLLLTRQMKFKRLVMLEQVSMAASVVVAIVLGILLRSFWALVIGEMVRVVLVVVLGYVIAPFRPAFRFVKSAAKDLWAYGKHVYASNVFLFLLLQGDFLVVGRMLSHDGARLGSYETGRRFAQLPAMMMAGLVSRVSFPAYARMGKNQTRVAQAYLRVMMFTTGYAWPVALGIVCMAPMIPSYAGPEWKSVVLPLQILCAATLAQAINSTAGSLFLGTGRPHLLTRVTLMNLALMAVLLFPLVATYGIEGAAAAISISQVLTCVVVLYLVRRTLKLDWKPLAKAVLMPLPAALVMTVLVLLLRRAGLHWLFTSLLAVPGGALCYGVVLVATAGDHVESLRSALRGGLRR